MFFHLLPLRWLNSLSAVVVLSVCALAAFTPGPRSKPPPQHEKRELFDEIVRTEPEARAQAKEDWAQHRWSQLDAFGNSEYERVTQVGRSKGYSTQSLFLVIDTGLRSHWPGPLNRALDITTVPLKPRPMD